MGNYTKTFGTGVIPTFNITPGQGNTSWKYGGDESAAILDEYLAERALAKAEQQDTFTNKTIPSIKKLLFPEADDVESGIADMVVDEIVNPDRMTDEETGKFSGSPSAATDAILEENAFEGDKPESWLEMGIDKFKGLFGNYDEDSPLAFNYEDGGRVYYADGTNEEGVQGYSDKSFYDGSGPISEEVAALKQRYMDDLNPTGMEAFKQMSEQFSDVAPEQIMDIIENKFPQYMNDPTDPFAGMEMEGEMAYGGRVGLQAGGMPFTPFMAPNYAAQYYNQNFNVPTIVPPAIQPIVDPNANNSGATGPMPPEGFGSLGPENMKPLQGPGSRGPEDRMEGFRPQDNPLSFSNPANQTTMKFVDGKLVYDNVNPYLRTGVAPGDEVPVASPLFAGLNLLGGLFGFDKKKTVDDEIAQHNLNKAKEVIDARKAEEAAAAKAAEEAAAAKALADEQALKAKEEYARKTEAERKAKEMADARAARQAASTEASRNAAVTRAQQQLAERVREFNNNPRNQLQQRAMTATGDVYSTRSYNQQQRDRNRQNNRGIGRQASKADRSRAAKGKTGGGFCFDPNTLVQMFDGSEKRIKDIKLGDKTKGGEVTGVFQFKAADEIHNYKGVIVAGSHYVKEDGRFIMVQDSPRAVKIDKIPVVHSLDTTGRRIWINDIEFADYNGDGIAKGFLANAGVDLTGFDQEVLRQVEHRLI